MRLWPRNGCASLASCTTPCCRGSWPWCTSWRPRRGNSTMRRNRANKGWSARSNMRTMRWARLADHVVDAPSGPRERHVAEAFSNIAGGLTEGTDIDFHLNVRGRVRQLPYDAQANMYLIGREAITNSVNHAPVRGFRRDSPIPPSRYRSRWRTMARGSISKRPRPSTTTGGWPGCGNGPIRSAGRSRSPVLQGRGPRSR